MYGAKYAHNREIAGGKKLERVRKILCLYMGCKCCVEMIWKIHRGIERLGQSFVLVENRLFVSLVSRLILTVNFE